MDSRVGEQCPAGQRSPDRLPESTVKTLKAFGVSVLERRVIVCLLLDFVNVRVISLPFPALFRAHSRGSGSPSQNGASSLFLPVVCVEDPSDSVLIVCVYCFCFALFNFVEMCLFAWKFSF